jgi:hypothetical protein
LGGGIITCELKPQMIFLTNMPGLYFYVVKILPPDKFMPEGLSQRQNISTSGLFSRWIQGEGLKDEDAFEFNLC